MLWFLATAAVLLLAGSGTASSAITVQDLRTAGKNQEVVVAQAKIQAVAGGRDDFIFEELAVFRPGQELQSPGVESDDCTTRGSGRELPMVAIIIDDMGYHQRLGAELLALEMNLTFSFLPHGPFTRDQGEQAWQQGRDVLVHMPMEARDPALDPGPGTLYLADPPDRLAQNVARNLAAVPHAVGVNNHMGSRFTENRAAMQQFFTLLDGQDLLFIDSGTSSASVAMETARAMDIRTARRHVFLDNIQTQEDICRQLKLLVKEAAGRGWAIGIGHPNQATLAALTKCRDILRSQVRLVGIHELAR